jgi:hypothetical protein
MRRNPKSLGKLVPSPLNFFDYVGLDRNLDDGRMSTGVQSSRDSLSVGDGGLAAVTTGSKKRSCPTESSATKRSKTIVNEVGAASHNQEPPMTPSELFVNRCRQCPLCIADDCGHCATCILNESRTRRFKEVCLRKVSSGTKLDSFAFIMSLNHALRCSRCVLQSLCIERNSQLLASRRTGATLLSYPLTPPRIRTI